jgi:hypothetical protein
MKFIDTIIQVSQLKEAKLFGPSKKASERPETGITIQTPSAFHVIKDCATIANRYLPLFVFGHYANPFEALRGKFEKADIVDFVNESKNDIVLFQLLTLILDKIKKTSMHVESAPAALQIDDTAADPYGDYEVFSTTLPSTSPQVDVISLLCTAFAVH